MKILSEIKFRSLCRSLWRVLFDEALIINQFTDGDRLYNFLLKTTNSTERNGEFKHFNAQSKKDGQLRAGLAFPSSTLFYLNLYWLPLLCVFDQCRSTLIFRTSHRSISLFRPSSKRFPKVCSHMYLSAMLVCWHLMAFRVVWHSWHCCVN